MKFSRKDYIGGICTHSEYYAQFVDSRTLAYVSRNIGLEVIKASTDPRFNDIPLVQWDRLVPRAPGSSKFKYAGDYYTLANGVCLLKEAARQLKEGAK